MAAMSEIMENLNISVANIIENLIVEKHENWQESENLHSETCIAFTFIDYAGLTPPPGPRLSRRVVRR